VDIPTDFWTGLKVTDVVIAAAAAVAVLVAFLQWRVYSRQATILEETRDIAFAGLGRPHVFFEFIWHNFNEWHEGRADKLVFFYKFTNYGTSPAIVSRILARALLSRGPGFGGDEKTTIIEPFPKPDRLGGYLRWVPVVNVAQRTESGWKSGDSWRTHEVFVISPQRSSTPFATNVLRAGSFVQEDVWPDGEEPLPRNRFEQYLYKQTGPDGLVAPWLIGQITYSDTSGQPHYTNFCIRAWTDGSYTECSEYPYNDRT
jgi:hypothetical protein